MYGNLIQQSIQQTQKREGIVNAPVSPPYSREDEGANSQGLVVRCPGAAKSQIPKSHLILQLACRSLPNKSLFSKPNPMVVVSLQRKTEKTTRYVEIGRTEVAKHRLNPDFQAIITIEHNGDASQKLLFEVYNVDLHSQTLRDQDFIGRTIGSVANLVADRSGMCEKELESKCGLGGVGRIIISLKESK